MTIKAAFLTGSRAYGVPRGAGHPQGESDIDLVVLVDAWDLYGLRTLADPQTPRAEAMDPDYEGASLRFGRLNLICCTEAEIYEAWRTGTEQLISEAMAAGCGTVSRERAVEVLSALRAAAVDKVLAGRT